MRFFYGPMNCGKSTMALQTDFNQRTQGRRGALLTRLDRSGQPRVSSRLGLDRPALEIDERDDLRAVARAGPLAADADAAAGLSTSGQPTSGRSTSGRPGPDHLGHESTGRGGLDYLVVDEAQFLTPEHIDQLAELADEDGTDCYVFGLATDFRGRLFPAAARLFEIADVLTAVPVEVLCWCGRPARFNARVVDHRRVLTGQTVLLGDTADEPDADPVGHYQVLCRRHHRDGRLGPIGD